MIKRYDRRYDDCMMQEYEDGNWVEYSDHQFELAKYNRLCGVEMFSNVIGKTDCGHAFVIQGDHKYCPFCGGELLRHGANNE
jgi:hypothetical protein